MESKSKLKSIHIRQINNGFMVDFNYTSDNGEEYPYREEEFFAPNFEEVINLVQDKGFKGE